jgi:hypothetical protein
MRIVDPWFGLGGAGFDDRLCVPIIDGLTIDDATVFDAVACMSVIDPWLGGGCAWLDNGLDEPLNRAGSTVDHTRFGPGV